MVRMSRLLKGLTAAATLALWLGLPQPAAAMTSIEGTLIGDQGYYWTTPAEVWIFPHRLGNIDNRFMLQWDGAPSPGLPGSGVYLYNLDGALTSSGVTSSVQGAPGGGFVLELMDGLNLGLWLAGYAPGHGAFVSRGVAATGWNAYGDAIGDMASINLFPLASALEAGRKVDLFASYWLPELDIEAGLRLWWGSAGISGLPDESTGPIDIDKDSDPATSFDPAQNGVDAPGDKLAVSESSYGLHDLGFGLGAGWSGIDGLRADLGFNINLLGVGWEPNGIGNYVDIGGSGFGVNLRSHYDLSDQWTVGGFVRFHTASMGLEPKLQRDGGNLIPLFTPPTADELNNLPDPTGTPPIQVDPASTSTEPFPSAGIKYEEGSSQLQLAALVKFTPNSRAKLYSAFGFRRDAFTSKTSIGSTWYAETSTSWMALPFIHIGAEGKVFDWMDLFLGASKQFRGQAQTTTSFDNRIPDNTNYPGATVGTPVTPGREDNTNRNRREQKTELSQDTPFTSTTSLMVGTRLHYKAFQLIAHLNPDWLLTGTYMLSGTANDMFAWLAVIYDWDYDADVETGNGTQKFVASPHKAEGGAYEPVRERARDSGSEVAPAPAPAPEPAPAPDYEEFDS